MDHVYDFLVFLTAAYGLVIAYAVFHYIAMGFSCFRMMRKASMKNPWMAWVPYCNAYALGNLADHYNLLCEGKDSTYRRKLLTWRIVSAALSQPIVLAVYAIKPEEELSPKFWLLTAAFLAVTAVGLVFYCITLHKIYKLFAPAGAAGLTVLSVFVSVAVPAIFLVLSNRAPHLPFTVAEAPAATPTDMDTGYSAL